MTRHALRPIVPEPIPAASCARLCRTEQLASDPVACIAADAAECAQLRPAPVRSAAAAAARDRLTAWCDGIEAAMSRYTDDPDAEAWQRTVLDVRLLLAEVDRS